MKTWLLSGLAALALGGVAFAQDTAVETIAVPVPSAPAVETVAVPFPTETVEAPSPYGECLASLAPAGARCRVVGTQAVGHAGGKPVTWLLYDIRSPRGRSGLSVLLKPELAASLPVSESAVDDWTNNPYPIAGVVRKGEAEYVAVSVRGDDGPETSSLHRVEGDAWTAVDATGLQYAVTTKLRGLTGGSCRVVAGGMNWRTFALRYDLMGDEGSCGAAFLDLGVKDGAVVVTDAMVVRQNLTPAPRRRARRR
jgi:hypothetical protein